MPIPTKALAIAAAGLVIAGLGLTWIIGASGPKDGFAECRAEKSGPVAPLGGPFTLTSETGAIMTEKDVFTKPTLLYFGYTYCPDVCPLDTMRNAQAAELLGERGYDVRPVFISVDSARDTPETLTAFTDVMSPDMLGLVGTPAQIKEATRAYRVLFSIQDPDDPDTLISHTTQTYLILPERGYVDYFERSESYESMADRVGCFLDHAAG